MLAFAPDHILNQEVYNTYLLTRVLQFDVMPVEQDLVCLYGAREGSCYIVYTGFDAFDLQLCCELNFSAGRLWTEKKNKC